MTTILRRWGTANSRPISLTWPHSPRSRTTCYEGTGGPKPDVPAAKIQQKCDISSQISSQLWCFSTYFVTFVLRKSLESVKIRLFIFFHLATGGELLFLHQEKAEFNISRLGKVLKTLIQDFETIPGIKEWIYSYLCHGNPSKGLKYVKSRESLCRISLLAKEHLLLW